MMILRLLLLLMLVSWVAARRIHPVSFLDSVSTYEVISINSAHFAPAAEGILRDTHPLRTQFTLEVLEAEYTVLLEKNLDLLHPSYSEERQSYDATGTLLQKNTHRKLDADSADHCWYQGHVLGHQHTSLVAVDTCSGGFKGVIHVEGQKLAVEPATKHLAPAHLQALLQERGTPLERHSDQHVVYKLQDKTHPKFACGVKDEATDGHGHGPNTQAHVHSHSSSNSGDELLQELHAQVDAALAAGNDLQQHEQRQKHSRQLLQTASDQKYVELVVVNDVLRFEDSDGSPEEDAVSVINLLDTYYSRTNFDPPINVVLVGQVTFDTVDPWDNTLTLGACADCSTGEAPVDELLSLFNTFRANPENIPAHDNAQLFSGHDFSGFTLGYASVSAMCLESRSSGIDQVLVSQGLTFNTAIVTHEMGHNFGMSHDSSSNVCPESGFIMNAVVDSGAAPEYFSDCSIDYLHDYLKDETKVCIDNAPTLRWGDPVCGNGFIEVGEDCDCGQSDCTLSDNPCCNGTSCLFVEEAVCSENDACCEGCQFVTDTSFICRSSAGECDIAETCAGDSGKCPSDFGRGSGTACTEGGYGDGLCYAGYCHSHLRQCRILGAAYVDGPYDHCPYNSQVSLNGWGSGTDDTKRPFFCSTVWCQNEPTSCTFFRQSSQISLIDDGIPCSVEGADGSYQCLNQQCVSSADLNALFTWVGSDWSNCVSCDEDQHRNVTCEKASTPGVTIVDDFCSPNSKLATAQQCQNATLACVFNQGLAEDELDLFGLVVTKNTLMFGSLGAVSFFLVILACCYQAVTYGEDDFHKLAPDEDSDFMF